MAKTYPAVTFVAAHGRRLSLAVAGVLALATLVASLLERSPFVLACGLAVAAGAWAFLRTASELVEVVAETLLPR